MKHILYVLPYLELGGTEKHAFSLMDNLQQHYHVSLLAPDGLGSAPFRQAGFGYQEFPRLEQNLWQGVPEQVTDGQTEFIAPPQDSLALAAGIDRLISDPVLLADFGKRGDAQYREKFDLLGMLNSTVDVYEKR